jgi:chromatin modification-related protein EAF6
MAENVPPGSAGKAATTDSTARGLPYYEKLRRDLRDTIQKKRILDKNIVRFLRQATNLSY